MVRRRGHAGRLERPLDERGDGDVPRRGELDRRPRREEPRRRSCAEWRAVRAGGMRAQYGPPADYDPETFGEGNAYYIPALMWDTIRQRLGDDEFWRLATRWLRTHRFTSQDRDTLAAWWSKQSGQDLTPLFHRVADSAPTSRPGTPGRSSESAQTDIEMAAESAHSDAPQSAGRNATTRRSLRTTGRRRGPRGCRRRRPGSASPSRRRCAGGRSSAPAWSPGARRSRRRRRSRPPTAAS